MKIPRRSLAALAAVAAAGALALVPAGAQAAGTKARASIIGGAPATSGEWPSIAALISSGQPDAGAGQFCGGTLVAAGWVLTAAHCVVNDDGSVEPASAIDVAVGALRLSEVTAEDRIRVAEIVPHPGYTPSAYGDDVALLRLSRNSGATPMTIIPESDDSLVAAGRPARIAGWGCDELPVGSPPECPSDGYPDQLRQAGIAIQSNATCSVYGADFISSEMICAGFGSPNVCSGDSGGPLTIVGSAGTPVLVGDTSYGDWHCAGAGDPGVFGRLSHYRGWINGVMGTAGRTAATFTRPATRSLGYALRHGLKERVRCSPACSVSVTLRVSSRTARRYGLGSRTTVGSGRASLDSGVTTTVTARFYRRARSRLARARSVKVTVASSATAGGYTPATHTSTVTLRR